jgi:hypothetical protein
MLDVAAHGIGLRSGTGLRPPAQMHFAVGVRIAMTCGGALSMLGRDAGDPLEASDRRFTGLSTATSTMTSIDQLPRPTGSKPAERDPNADTLHSNCLDPSAVTSESADRCRSE